MAQSVEITPPSIRFDVTPPLVVVSPGIQVVEDYGHEVFLVSGFYWVRHNGHWFKAKGHHGQWVHVGPKLVPASLVKLTPGHYKHFKGKQIVKANSGKHNGFFGTGKKSGGGGGKAKGKGKH